MVLVTQQNTAGSWGSTNDKWYFINSAALIAAYPVGQAGWFAEVWNDSYPATIWLWDNESSVWVNTGKPPSTTNRWSIAGTLSNQTDLQSALNLKQGVFTGICEMHPITEANIVIDYTARTLTIIPPTGTIRFFTDWGGVSVEHNIVGNVTFPAWTDTTGTRYFYFDSTGTPITTQTAWTIDIFNTIATVYRIWWNATKSPDTAKSISEFLETHPNDISAKDHERKHAYGAIWINGLDIYSNAIASGTPDVGWLNTCIGLSSGILMDDNLQYTITNDTSSSMFHQDLWPTIPANITLSNGGVFNIRYKGIGWLSELVTGSRFPFLYNPSTNIPQYVDTSGNRQDVSSTNFVVYFVYGITDPRNWQTIRVTPAYAQYTSLTNAQAVTWETVKAQDTLANDNEIRPLYRLIFEYRSSYNVAIKKAALRSVQDLRKSIVTQSTTSVGSLPATSVTVTPAGNITSTNAQSALQELDTIKQSICLTGATSPEWLVNATHIGQLYMNTTVNADGWYDCYIAVTTTGKRQQIFVSPNS